MAICRGKKGQLTIYIILGVLILSIFLTFQFRPERLTPGPENGSDQVQQYLESCFRKAAATSLLRVENEGSEDQRMSRIPHEDYDVAVLVQGAQSLVPALKSLEGDIAAELISTYSECKPYLRFPFTIKQNFDSAKASVDVMGNAAKFTISVPSSMTVGERQITAFGEHTTTITTNLKSMHEAAIALAGAIAETPDMLPLNELLTPPFESYVYPTDDNKRVIRIMDNDPSTYIADEPQVYTFGVSR